MASFAPNLFKPNPNAGADLRDTVSLLRDLAAHAEAALDSVSTFLHSNGTAFYGGRLSPGPGFCCCPYDPRHRMPPESLFRHSLRCPSSPGGPILDLGFLETMRYPGSFKSEVELRRENTFVRPLPESGADLCFSLEKELEDVGVSSFFYRRCHGVVTFPVPDVAARTFTLPGVLSLECANFICGSREREDGISGGRSFHILPSEFWGLRREVEAWKDYPERYSYTAARVASCLEEAGDCGLRKWIISSSPRFGIVIDTAMRDHMFLLLKLCLKAIRREASGFLELLSGNDGPLDPMSLCLKCPCLLQTSAWLASQLCILYGETNGKTFAISMVAESLLRVGSSLLLFSLDEYSSTEETNGVGQETFGSKSDADVTDGVSKSFASEGTKCAIGSEGFCTGQVFVSQVAAAVAALHERSMLEDRVKQLRFPQLLSKYQLINEHSNVSTRANEVRAKRPNYRPVLENDGLLWQKPQNQDMGRAKTRQELLAEERDYKRRRMSYRGKKVKRTTTQVIHDIIEEHMEEIKQAGGIGCNVRGSADAGMLISTSSSQGDGGVDVGGVRGKESEPCGSSVRDSFVNEETHYAEFSEDAYREDSCITDHYWKKVRREQRYINHRIQESSERIVATSERMNYEYGRSSNYKSHRQSSDRYTHQRENGDKEERMSKYDRRNSLSSRPSKGYTDRSSLSSNSLTKEEDSHPSDRRKRVKGSNHDSCRSECAAEITFEDRYDPCTTYEDVSSDVCPSKKYYPTTDVDGYRDLQRHHHSNKRT